MQQTGRLLLLIVHLGQLSQLGRSWQLRPQTHKVFCPRVEYGEMFRLWRQDSSSRVPRLVGATVLGALLGFTTFDDGSILNHPSSHLQVVQSALAADTPLTSTGLADILPIRDRLAAIRSALTGEKVSELRVGDTLVDRLRAVDGLLDGLQKDIYRDTVDWEAVQVYPKILRAYSPLFTVYTDRAFPANTEIDAALRYALRYEVGGFYSGVTDFERALEKQSQRQAQRAYARISIAFDHYLKAGDLYSTYEGEIFENTDAWARRDLGMINSAELKEASSGSSQLNYIAPSIEAPGLQDEVVLLKGPDKGRIGIVLWIFKDDKFSNNIVVKLEKGDNDHSEVRLYPYSLVAKTTPPEIQFFDDLLAAYIASAISSGIMYPIDTYKTRVQIGKRGIPRRDEGGFLVLWRGVEWFIADPNDSVYIASYGIIKSALLAPIDVTNSLAVFSVVTLAGSIGDAIGSMFRAPLETVWKQIQTGAETDGGKVLVRVLQPENLQALLVAWIAVLCRDVPFAGLQIALFDVYKNLLSGLDDAGLSVFLQRALWGALAGGTAAFLTTPFDNLTTNLMTASEDEADAQARGVDPLAPAPQSLPITGRFAYAWSELVSGGLSSLYVGAVPRTLFFAPAGMIFFSVYESLTEIILDVQSGDLRLKFIEDFHAAGLF